MRIASLQVDPEMPGSLATWSNHANRRLVKSSAAIGHHHGRADAVDSGADWRCSHAARVALQRVPDLVERATMLQRERCQDRRIRDEGIQSGVCLGGVHEDLADLTIGI